MHTAMRSLSTQRTFLMSLLILAGVFGVVFTHGATRAAGSDMRDAATVVVDARSCEHHQTSVVHQRDHITASVLSLADAEQGGEHGGDSECRQLCTHAPVIATSDQPLRARGIAQFEYFDPLLLVACARAEAPLRPPARLSHPL